MIKTKKSKLPRKHLPGENVRQRMLRFTFIENNIVDILVFVSMLSFLGLFFWSAWNFLAKSEEFKQIGTTLSYTEENAHIALYANFIHDNWLLTIAVFIIAVIIFMGLCCFFIVPKITEWIIKARFDDLEQGWIGEAAVGEALATAGRDNWKTYHAIPMDNKADIDHVLICQRGVFCLETKTIGDKDAKIVLNDENVFLGSAKMKKQPLPQARGNALWLSKKIKRETGINKFVIPIVVFPFGQVTDKNYPEPREFTFRKDKDKPFAVCSARALQRILKYFGEIEKETDFTLNEREVKEIGNVLDSLARIE